MPIPKDALMPLTVFHSLALSFHVYDSMFIQAILLMTLAYGGATLNQAMPRAEMLMFN